jgi:hypothetical protein
MLVVSLAKLDVTEISSFDVDVVDGTVVGLDGGRVTISS